MEDPGGKDDVECPGLERRVDQIALNVEGGEPAVGLGEVVADLLQARREVDPDTQSAESRDAEGRGAITTPGVEHPQSRHLIRPETHAAQEVPPGSLVERHGPTCHPLAGGAPTQG